MKGLLWLAALVALECAASWAGTVIGREYGDHWWGRGAYLPLMAAAGALWVVLAVRIVRRRPPPAAAALRTARGTLFDTETPRTAPAAKDAAWAAYRRERERYIDGEISLEEFTERCRTYGAPRAPKRPAAARRDDDKMIALFKDIMASSGKELTSMLTGPDLTAAPGGPRYKPGQYVRVRQGHIEGRIYRVEKVRLWDGSTWQYDCTSPNGAYFAFEHSLALALPRQGERWVYRDCETHHHAWDGARCERGGFTVTQADQEWAATAGYAEDYALCGCLVPVHFTQGHPKGDGPFRVGQWIRHRVDGRLGNVAAVAGGTPRSVCTVRFGLYSSACLEDLLEPATPREDEWWIKERCPKDHGGTWLYEPCEWTKTDPSAIVCAAALCGCFHPINWGRGTATA